MKLLFDNNYTITLILWPNNDLTLLSQYYNIFE